MTVITNGMNVSETPQYTSPPVDCPECGEEMIIGSADEYECSIHGDQTKYAKQWLNKNDKKYLMDEDDLDPQKLMTRNNKPELDDF